jgi:hypothetical protein
MWKCHQEVLQNDPRPTVGNGTDHAYRRRVQGKLQLMLLMNDSYSTDNHRPPVTHS